MAVAVAVAVDLGTTRFKAANLEEDGSLGEIFSLPAPALSGEGLLRENDPLETIARARKIVGAALGRGPAIPLLGITSQRSSFLLWEKATGRPLTPVISWQDRRAAAWCRARHEREEELRRLTGLRLSPHYAGPKLAYLLESSPELRRRAERGEILFGTLECRLIWELTAGAVHETDLSMAARTMMVSSGGVTANWCEETLEEFHIPREILPAIRPSLGRRTAMERSGIISATIGDQPAATLSVARPDGRDILVNMGTGVFVIRPSAEFDVDDAGLLAAPLLSEPSGRVLYSREGPVNAGAMGAAGGAGEFPDRDDLQDAFTIPDSTGIGAPHWRPEMTPQYSESARGLCDADARRIFLEGILFRVREIVERLESSSCAERIILAGGLSRNSPLVAGLASLLERPITPFAQVEATLLGTARLAAGLSPFLEEGAGEAIAPGGTGLYLPEKFRRWERWRAGVLASADRGD